MALFKISKGLKNNLPSSKTDGWCYFTTDDGKFWIDYKDTDNALKRKAVNAAYADAATKATQDSSGNNIVNTYATKTALKSVSDLVGSTSVSSQITNATASKADKTHTHNYAGSSSAGGPANYLKAQSGNEINFKGLTDYTIVHFNYRDADTNASATNNLITGYYFDNKARKTTGVTLYADNFSGTAAKAISDGSGNNIVNTYATKTALNGKANAGQKTTSSAGGHSHSISVPTASITTEGTAASYTGHSFNAGSGSFTASVDANGVLSFSHTHTASTHNAGSFSANKPTKISITNTDYTTNSTGGHTHSITI